MFMIAYGLLIISFVDNIIKPYIISRGTRLSFIVMLIGVLGGIMTFGFIGVFLGPTLLAVGYSLAQEILIRRRQNPVQTPQNQEL
jgi:predicted PurR-regulated permease PerM